MNNGESMTEQLTDLTIECNNLFYLTKLLVKDILKTAVKFNRKLDEDHSLIVQILRVLEAVTRHGLKPKRLLNSVPLTPFSSLDPWSMICDILRDVKCCEIIESVQQMGLKSNMEKFRAWLKLALMQRRLGEYYRNITEQTKKLENYYYPAALLLSDKGTEISGLLIGLSVIECNFYKFKEVLESESNIGILNYSQYMNNDFDDSNSLTLMDETTNNIEESETVKSLLDQKNYTEELNSILEAKVQKLQDQVSHFEKDASQNKIKLAELTNQNQILNGEVVRLQNETEILRSKFDHRSQLMKDDLEVERNTYQTSRQELYQMNLNLETKLKEEINVRLEVEKTLQNEIKKKLDLELATETLERQVQEKQETITELRKNLETVKSTNTEITTEISECQKNLEHKIRLIEKLEEKSSGMSLIMDQMDQRIKKLNSEKINIENLNQQQCDEMMDIKQKEKETQEYFEEKINELNDELEKIKCINISLLQETEKNIKQIEFYEQENRQLKISCQEQSEALEQMAELVENSKLESEGLREMQASFQEAKWTDDREVNDCNQCNRPFNVSRRKHHCRRCGGVFCHDCSGSKMPLASSSKPMRVCDTCLSVLIKNYTSSNTATVED